MPRDWTLAELVELICDWLEIPATEVRDWTLSDLQDEIALDANFPGWVSMALQMVPEDSATRLGDAIPEIDV